MFRSDFHRAMEDYTRARREAAIQNLLARLSGSQDEISLLSYDQVRQQLKAVEKSGSRLDEIPLDAIVGSVGRYHDFTREYLPKKSIDQQRWARVMTKTQDLVGLPPIEVYQIGEVYFVRDGNHRVSVTRQMGNETIQAYITEVESKVSLPPDITPDELIIKSEQVNFLEKTHLDKIVPESELIATKAGAYPTLLEHIAVHRHYMGLTQEREITFREASQDWYEKVYLPVLDLIQQQDLLRDFPDRTAIDLYLWAADHRASLQDQVGWDIGPEAALTDLSVTHSRRRRPQRKPTLDGIFRALLPDRLESGPPPGTWRERLSRMRTRASLFSDVIVALDDGPNTWNALDLTLMLAKAERSRVHGVHIHGQDSPGLIEDHTSLKDGFESSCRQAGVTRFDFRIAEGEIWRILSDQSRFADLVVLPLNHPPGERPFERLSSGITNLLRNSPVPVLTVPRGLTDISRICLAFDGSLKAREALFLSAYLGTQMSSDLIVITSSAGLPQSESIQAEAREYLKNFPPDVEYWETTLDITTAIAEKACLSDETLIVLGGHGGTTILPIMLGSIVDQVLREIKVPVLIVR